MAGRILLEELNPHGTRVATLEDDGRSVYLYLSPADDYPGETRAVWVRNLVPAPDEMDLKSMKAGRAPLISKMACAHPDGAEEFSVDDLDLVWFPEGSGVSLYVEGLIEAIIPPWSGYDGLQGYARACMDGQLGTLPMPAPESAFFDRLQENLDYWTTRADPEHWSRFRDRLLAHYESAYGPHKQYYALLDRKFPMLAVAEFEVAGRAVFATLGMSDQNQPGVERRAKDASGLLRVEIVSFTDDRRDWFPGVVGRMAAYPWISDAFFASGHTYESGADGPRADFILTGDFSLINLPEPAPLTVDGRYPVTWLAAAPAPGDYLNVARVRGAEQALRKIYGA